MSDVRQRWTLDDVIAANELLDAFIAAESAAMQQAKADAKPRRY